MITEEAARKGSLFIKDKVASYKYSAFSKVTDFTDAQSETIDKAR